MELTRKGETVHVEGIQPKVGDIAPNIALHNLNDQEITLHSFKGKVVVLSVVPDIDTRVCAIQTKHFNQDAAAIPEVQFITISNNTKEEQAGWCAAEGIDMEMLHDTEHTFGAAYGLLVTEMGRLARSVFVIDQNGKIVYEEIVPEISSEPDYQKALAVAKDTAAK